MSKKERISTHFINYGTFRASGAEILKREFTKRGIPTKILYPGTNIGRESYGHAAWTAYKLMVRENDIPRADEIRMHFNIERIEKRDKMPLPKTWKWSRRGLGRWLLLIGLLSFFILYVGSIVLDLFGKSIDNFVMIFVGISLTAFFLWIVLMFYKAIREKMKN